MKIIKAIALAAALLLTALSTLSGMLMNYLFIFLLISMCYALATRLTAFFRKGIQWHIWRFETKSSFVRVAQATFRNACWILIGICIHTAIVPIQFSKTDYSMSVLYIWASVIVLCLLDWVPIRSVSRISNAFFIILFLFVSCQFILIYAPPWSNRQITLVPPFRGEWYVVQGGNSPLINHHYFAGSQRYALDLFVEEDGEVASLKGKALSSLRTFDMPILAPVDGVVVDLESQRPDLEIGQRDTGNPSGNYIAIKTEAEVFVYLAHLRRGSITVEVGEEVNAGQVVAKAGNSGNTSQPHLHLQAMTGMKLRSPESKPVPMRFLTAGGQAMDYRRNDRILGDTQEQ